MSTPNDGADRRASLLGRLQETGERHDAAEIEQRATQERTPGNEMMLVRQAAAELRAAAEETRRLNAEMRRQFIEFLDELRRTVKR